MASWNSASSAVMATSLPASAWLPASWEPSLPQSANFLPNQRVNTNVLNSAMKAYTVIDCMVFSGQGGQATFAWRGLHLVLTGPTTISRNLRQGTTLVGSLCAICLWKEAGG